MADILQHARNLVQLNAVLRDNAGDGEERLMWSRELVSIRREFAPDIAKALLEAVEVAQAIMSAHKRRGAVLTAACGDDEAVIKARAFLSGIGISP